MYCNVRYSKVRRVSSEGYYCLTWRPFDSTAPSPTVVYILNKTYPSREVNPWRTRFAWRFECSRSTNRPLLYFTVQHTMRGEAGLRRAERAQHRRRDARLPYGVGCMDSIGTLD